MIISLSNNSFLPIHGEVSHASSPSLLKIATWAILFFGGLSLCVYAVHRVYKWLKGEKKDEIANGFSQFNNPNISGHVNGAIKKEAEPVVRDKEEQAKPIQTPDSKIIRPYPGDL